MIEVLERFLDFDLYLAYHNNFDLSEYDDYEMIKDYYTLFKKFGMFDANYFIDNFAKTLTETTHKNWRLTSTGGKYQIVCEDGENIPINGDLSQPKIRIQDNKSANYYIKTAKYYELIYVTYKHLFDQSLIDNAGELYAETIKILTKYRNKRNQIDKEIEKIKKDYNATNPNKNRFMSDAIALTKSNASSEISKNLSDILTKYEYGYLSEGLFGEYNPQYVIEDINKLLSKLAHNRYALELHSSDKNAKVGGSNLSVFGFDVDKSGRSTVSGSRELFAKACKIVTNLTALLNSDDFTRQNLIDADYVLKMDTRKFENSISKISNLINDFGEFILTCKAGKVDEIMAAIKQNDPKIVLPKSYIKAHIHIKEIDEYACILNNFCGKVVVMLGELVQVRQTARTQLNKDLLKSAVISKLRSNLVEELTEQGSKCTIQIEDLKYEKDYIQYEIDMLESVAHAVGELDGVCYDKTMA